MEFNLLKSARSVVYPSYRILFEGVIIVRGQVMNNKIIQFYLTMDKKSPASISDKLLYA